MHLYSVSPRAEVVHDHELAADAVRDVTAFLGASERIVGFAYDPFTDHFFLRLEPGNRIRVVDRPALKIKREFVVEGAQGGSGDMAVRPRDGHLLLIDGDKPELLEVTRLGAYVQRMPLAGLSAAPLGIAVDMKTEDILILDSNRRVVHRYATGGHELEQVTLDRSVTSCLGYDADKREIYAPLGGPGSGVGVFSSAGKLIRTVEVAAGDTLIDTGPHSFFRMF